MLYLFSHINVLKPKQRKQRKASFSKLLKDLYSFPVSSVLSGWSVVFNHGSNKHDALLYIYEWLKAVAPSILSVLGKV